MSKQLQKLERSFRRTLNCYAQINEIPLLFETESSAATQFDVNMSEGEGMLPVNRVLAQTSIDLTKELGGGIFIPPRKLYTLEISMWPTYRSADIGLITETTNATSEREILQRAVLCGLEAALSFSENKKFEYVTVTPFGRPDKQIVDMYSMHLGIAPINAGEAYAPFDW